MSRDFKSYFQKNEGAFDETPSKEMWYNLEQRLESRKGMVTIPLWRKMVIAAGFLLVISVVGTYLYQSGYQKGQNEAIFATIEGLEDLKPIGNVGLYEKMSQNGAFHRSSAVTTKDEKGKNKGRITLRVRQEQVGLSSAIAYEEEKEAKADRSMERKSIVENKSEVQDGNVSGKYHEVGSGNVATHSKSNNIWTIESNDEHFSIVHGNYMEDFVLKSLGSKGIMWQSSIDVSKYLLPRQDGQVLVLDWYIDDRLYGSVFLERAEK